MVSRQILNTYSCSETTVSGLGDIADGLGVSDDKSLGRTQHAALSSLARGRQPTSRSIAPCCSFVRVLLCHEVRNYCVFVVSEYSSCKVPRCLGNELEVAFRCNVSLIFMLRVAQPPTAPMQSISAMNISDVLRFVFIVISNVWL